MEIEKLSGGYARIAQLMQVLFFVPIILILLFLGHRAVENGNFGLDTFIFISSVIIVSILIVKNTFTYADIYLENSSIILKKLFQVKKVPVSECSRIGKALMPLTYYIEFEEKQRVYFFLTAPKILRRLSSSDSDIIVKEITSKIRRIKENERIPAANPKK